MGCKTGLVTRLQECYPEVEEIASDREVERERETVRKIGTAMVRLIVNQSVSRVKMKLLEMLTNL